MRMMWLFVTLMVCSSLPVSTKAMELVKDGLPMASIVLDPEALPQVKFAASELQLHLEKISGAKLVIASTPQEGLLPVYVGPGQAAASAGVKEDDLEGEAFRIIATEKYLALVGHDELFPRYPRGHVSRHARPQMLKDWQETVGHAWDFPKTNLYDPRNHSSELGFSIYDPTGTLFAVYELLEQLGVRWYMPYHDFGTIIPESKNVTIHTQHVTKKPVFSHRFVWFSFADSDPEGFLWFKRQKLGMSQKTWYGHGVSYVTRYQKETRPELFSTFDGRLQITGDGPGHPRLAEPLAKEMALFVDKVFTVYPEMRYCPIGPADGYIRIDDRDKQAGWMREEEYGYRGMLSDYAWKFMNSVATKAYQKHPDRIVMGLAYSAYQTMPKSIKEFSPNMGLAYCQNRSMDVTPQRQKENSANREAWINAIRSGEIFVWEYYLFGRVGDKLRGVPVIFTKIQQREARELSGKIKGEYIECWSGKNRMANPASNHLTYYLQAKLYWNPELDLQAFMEDYCQQFYGPAASQMQTYYRFAEDVWMRPGNRDPYTQDAFITPADVDQYFKLLEAAKAAAGDSVYGQRIAMIIEEIQPIKAIFPYQEAMAQGEAEAKRGDVEASAQAYKVAIASAQNARHKADAMFFLGMMYRDVAKDDGKALEQFLASFNQPVIKRRGRKWWAMMYAFDILRQQKRLNEALALLDQFPQNTREDYWQFKVLQARGKVAHDQGDTAKTKQYFEQALALPAAPQKLKDQLIQDIKKLDQ